jgi:serine/threonine protein kinase/Tol biopolymer transport system component
MEIQSENGRSALRPGTRLSVGDRLGRFEILGPLGRGGMGDVFRARDPQLRREVAIKVLPTAFSRDPDRQRRFEQEARAAASLNHPNIVAIHDVGVHEGIGFIVTELLEGETLRERMNGRPLPPRKAVEYAIQIASGLAAGHERGIVHRDIKPDNLFVTTDGRVKVLDFGVAKMIDPDSADDATATVTLDGVQLGPVVGTAAYMSPEQARGLRTDHRSDIFSAGAVLYEMLAGFAPFRRSTPAETLIAILHDEPPDLTRVASIAPPLERIVRHCLEKTPEQRFQNVRDFIFDLDALPRDAWTAEPKRVRLRVSRRSGLTVLAILVLTAAAYFAGQWAVPSLQPAPLHRVLRLTDFPGLEEFPSVSPDRRSVAFTATVDGRRQIFVRLIARGSAVQITKDAADHQLPRWSPDGNSLVYFSPAAPGDAQGAIWSIPALGGSARQVITSIGDADVNRDARLACFRLVEGGVQLVTSSLDGTDVRVVARSVPGYHRYPRWSPDGQWIAFQRGDGLRYDIFVISPTTGETRQLTHDRNIINGLAWLPDSTGIIYGSSRGNTIPYLPSLSLWEVRLDGQVSRQITAAEVWYEQPDVDAAGRISAARLRMRFDILRFPFGPEPADNVRRAVPVTRQTGQVLTPTVAPDGGEVAFLSDSGGHGNLWVTSTQTGEIRQITFEDDPNVTVGVPVWSPDGRSIAFVSSKGHTGFDFGVWLVNPDGTNLRAAASRGLGPAWSSDGQWLYYAATSAGVLYKVSSSGGAAIKVRSEPTRNVIGLHGPTLYFMVERPLLDGRPEFEIRAATPEDGPSRALARIPASRVPSWQIVNPALSPDGEWLAMPLTDGFTTNIWALSSRTGTWRQVTDFGDRATFIARRVSWSPDGKSILAAVGEGDADIVLLDGLVKTR